MAGGHEPVTEPDDPPSKLERCRGGEELRDFLGLQGRAGDLNRHRGTLERGELREEQRPRGIGVRVESHLDPPGTGGVGHLRDVREEESRVVVHGQEPTKRLRARARESVGGPFIDGEHVPQRPRAENLRRGLRHRGVNQADRAARTLQEPIRVVVHQLGRRRHDADVVREREPTGDGVGHPRGVGHGWVRRPAPIDGPIVRVDVRRRSERLRSSLRERRGELHFLLCQRGAPRVFSQRARRPREIFRREPSPDPERGEELGVRRELRRDAVEVRT